MLSTPQSQNHTNPPVKSPHHPTRDSPLQSFVYLFRDCPLLYTPFMPSKNSIKQYEEGGIYHIYNRGINKQNIFLDKKDYARFLFYLKLYLEEPENTKDIDVQQRNLKRRNFHENIDLLLYCLMPNHIHLAVKQKGEKDIVDFMKCVMTNYSMYFNKRYQRIGTLFQGRYKAILVKNDEYFLHLSRYIHLNPSKLLNKGQSLVGYDYSSYSSYLGLQNIKWLEKNLVLDYFKDHQNDPLMKSNSYKSFVEYLEYDSKEILGTLAIDG